MSKTTTQEITIGGGISAGIAQVVVASVEAKYQVTTGQQIAKTVEFEIEAKPGTNLVYKVSWTRVWAEGDVTVQSSDGTLMKVPFTIKHSLRGELTDPVDMGCK